MLSAHLSERVPSATSSAISNARAEPLELEGESAPAVQEYTSVVAYPWLQIGVHENPLPTVSVHQPRAPFTGAGTWQGVRLGVRLQGQDACTVIASGHSMPWRRNVTHVWAPAPRFIEVQVMVVAETQVVTAHLDRTTSSSRLTVTAVQARSLGRTDHVWPIAAWGDEL